MSDYSDKIAAAEIVRVQRMNPEERSRFCIDYLRWNEGLNSMVNAMKHNKRKPNAHSFETLEAKNRFDEERLVKDMAELAASRRV